MEIRIDPRRTATALFVAAVALALLHVAGMLSRYVLGHGRLLGTIDTFNMNYENNVPTFFSTMLLVACAAVLAVVARRPGGARREARYWGWLAAIFLFLALDEDASIHELWIGPIQYFLPMDGLFYFAWVIPYGIALLFIGGLYLRFVLGLPEPMRRLTLAAGALYVGGAFVLEMIGGWYLSVIAGGDVDFAYSIIVAVEEFLEMSGSILFLYALLDFLGRSREKDGLRIVIRPS
jgi:hypothetical protein